MTSYKSAHNDKKPAVGNNSKNSRPATYREARANNEASARTGSKIFNIASWMHLIAEELAAMNAGKPGRPYEYCTSMMLWIMAVMGFSKELTFRKTAGIASGVLNSHGIPGPHYSTILRRITSMASAMLEPYGTDGGWMLASYVRPRTGSRRHRVAVDSTGLNLSKTTLWRENKWGVGPDRRGWLKVHAMVDVDSGEILAYILTQERVGDNRAFIPLMNLVLGEGYDIHTVFADNAYEANENWKMLHELGIRFVVRFKSNTAARSNGCIERGESAQMWVREGPKRWTKITGFGIRWKIEVAFSDLKRLAAETVAATADIGMEREVLLKVLAYNMHKRIRADMIGITGNDVLVAED